jgi:hypothetical protein
MSSEGRNFDKAWLSDDFADLSGWVIPKVRFVEVRSASRKWILTPPEESIPGRNK